MKINIYPDILFRTPKFSYKAELADCWEELKIAISISSDAFYQTIANVKAEELNTLPPKVLFTIWKYFNRAKFRSTPYGTFAGFSTLSNAISQRTSQIEIEEKQLVHEFIDWPQKNKIEFSLSDRIKDNCILFTNSSYYLTSTEIRYIAWTDGVFELAEIDNNEDVLRILNASLEPVCVLDLVSKLHIAEEEKDDFYALLEDMLSIQLLLSDMDPNIIGNDYFERIGFQSEASTPKYLISERKAISGSIDEQLLSAVPSLINFMQHLLPNDERDALKQFINKFGKKFEQNEIPLSIALDPEMGIGYDELEQSEQDDDFVNQFNGKKDKKDGKGDNNFKQKFKELLNAQSLKSRETFRLDKFNLPLIDKPATIPNSFSLLMSIVDDVICVDQIGGSTANALSGRFTMASDAVYNQCRQIARIEQEANPEILFFDVAYMAETNVDNVNRRKLVYNHQLSILNFDTSGHPLSIDDIMLSIQNGEVILRSKKLNKRLVPRMASAYNYTRSDLSVFRFLCDLQRQSIQTSLNFSLDNIYPDLDYYPRVQYQNIILSQRKWQIKKENIIKFGIAESRVYLKQLGLSEYFKTGLSDQTLCFNVNIDEDLNAFLHYMQKKEVAYLEEVLIAEKHAVLDEQNKPYLAQFILNIYHKEKNYQGFSVIEGGDSVVKQFYAPGSKWLYFEIYCHQQRSDMLLAGPLTQFLEAYQNRIKSWFFIRYNENGNHLRFRILLDDEKYGYELTAAISNYLEDEIETGLVSDVQIRTYKREIQRYGADLIDEVEKHFSIDSTYVLSLFETYPDVLSKYKFCADLVEIIQKEDLFDNSVLKNIIQMMSDSFNREHDIEATDFKKINAQYQSYRKTEYSILNKTQQHTFNSFSNSFINLLKQCDSHKKVKLFTDLLHMHVNRLFNKKQRTHEMIVYYFLLKDIQRRNALNRN